MARFTVKNHIILSQSNDLTLPRSGAQCSGRSCKYLKTRRADAAALGRAATACFRPIQTDGGSVTVRSQSEHSQSTVRAQSELQSEHSQTSGSCTQNDSWKKIMIFIFITWFLVELLTFMFCAKNAVLTVAMTEL